MAAFFRSHSLFFCFLILLVFSLKTQARAVRESHYFNKAVRDDKATEPQNLVDTNPKQEDPTTFPQSETGYGLYGNRYNKESPSTTTFTAEEYNARNNVPSKFSTKEYTQEKNFERKGTTTFTAEEYNARNNVPSKFSTEEYTQENSERKELYPNAKYGMSDTRFLENGRYFYDINGEKNQNQNLNENRYNNMGYRSTKGNNNYYNSNNMGYYNSKYNNYGGSYYGNNENVYEVDNNSMNRFRNPQESEFEEDFEP